MLASPPQHTVEITAEAADKMETAELEDLTAGVDSNQTPPNDQSAETRFVYFIYFNIFYAVVVCIRVSTFNFKF